MHVLSWKGSFRNEHWWTTTDHQIWISITFHLLKYFPRDKRQDLAPYNCAQHFRVQAVASTIWLFTFSFFRRLAGGSTIAIILFSPPHLSDLNFPMKVHHSLSGSLDPLEMDTIMEIGTNIARLKWHWNLNKIDDWHAIYITTSQYFCVFSGLKDPKSKTYRLDCFTLPWVIAP